MNWNSPESERFRRTLKMWSRKFASRIKRSDLAEDIESSALLFFAQRGSIGWECTKELERYVKRACSLSDDLKLSRDSDLTARVNMASKDRAHCVSYVEEYLEDPQTEDDLLAVIDGEERKEGRDQAELLEDIDQASSELLSFKEDQVYSLRYLWGYSIRETARYLDCHQSHVSALRKRARTRLQAKSELRRFEEKCAEDPAYSQMEVSWIRL